MKLPIARFNGKTVMPMTKPNPFPRPMTMEDILAKQSRVNVLRPAPRKLRPGTEEDNWKAMQAIENGWTRTTAERPKVAG